MQYYTSPVTFLLALSASRLQAKTPEVDNAGTPRREVMNSSDLQPQILRAKYLVTRQRPRPTAKRQKMMIYDPMMVEHQEEENVLRGKRKTPIKNGIGPDEETT